MEAARQLSMKNYARTYLDDEASEVESNNSDILLEDNAELMGASSDTPHS